MSTTKTERVFATGTSTARSCLSLVIVAVSLIPAGLLLFSLFAGFSYFAELAGAFRLQFLILLLPFPLLLWAVGSWRWALVVTGLVAWFGISLATVYVPPIQPPPGPEPIKIMSFNVLAQNRSFRRVLTEIETEDPDIIGILEYAEDWPLALKKLNGEYPHQLLVPRWHGFGAAIFSKRPLTDPEVFMLQKDLTDIPVLSVRVSCGQETVRIGLIHVLSPTNHFRLHRRNQQFEEIGELLGRTDEPLVVMGDFNCVPWSPFLTRLRRDCRLRDSRRGFGHHASWHTAYWPLQIPIDHAFVSGDVHVHERHIGKHAGSDHLPQILTISVK